jgi:maleate isomerase
MSDATSVRVGVLVPQGNTVHAAEFERLKPPSVTFKFLSFGYPPMSDDFCVDLVQNMAPAMEAFQIWGAQVVLVGCTTASMACVSDSFTRQLEAIAGVPVVTAAGAAKEAIAAFDIDTLAVATPYGAVNNGIVQDFLVKSGVAVAAIQGLNLDRSVEVWIAGQPTLTPDKVFELSCKVDNDVAQGLYLPCTGMGSIDAIDRFERAVGKPAFSSVQAGYWAALRRAGFDGRQSGAGRLLEQWDF